MSMKYDVVVGNCADRAGGSSPGHGAHQRYRPSMEAGARSNVGVLENEWRIGPWTQLFLYHHTERRNEAMNIDFGVQVARPFEREGNVQCIETPTGEVARTVHVGPYDRLGDAHNAIHAWCAANNQKIAQASWEIYGDWNDDPALLETTIKYLLA